MILLHGGLGSGEMFGPILPQLADHHHRDSARPAGARPHGRHRPADRHGPLGRRHRGPHRPPGTGPAGRSRLLRGRRVGLHTAFRYPGKICRLVALSANIRRDAIYPEMLEQQGSSTCVRAGSPHRAGRGAAAATPSGRATHGHSPPGRRRARPRPGPSGWPTLRGRHVRPERGDRRDQSARLIAGRTRLLADPAPSSTASKRAGRRQMSIFEASTTTV